MPWIFLGLPATTNTGRIAHGQVDQQVVVGVQPLGIARHDGFLELAQRHLEAGQVAFAPLQRASASIAVR